MKSKEPLSYRPRNAGHDYCGRGTYLITLVVSGREQLLSYFATFATFATENGHKAENGRIAPVVPLVLTPLGEVVREAWLQIPVRSLAHGNKVVVHACVCMPDHFHGVIEVLEPMQWSLGDIIQAFKAFCTSSWQRQQGLPSSTIRPISVDCRSDGAPAWLREKAAFYDNEGDLIRGMSKKQRREYYTFVGRQQRPLFDDNYDDTVCLDERHRKHPVTGSPYEETDDYDRERSVWEHAIMEGGTVIVTPGISRGKQQMKNECIERGYPLIHLQATPIGQYWKPEKKRFEACVSGSLLILAPWDLDTMGDVGHVPSDSDYSRFHNLNTLAAEISTFNGEAKIIR